MVRGRLAPDASTEYLLYQTLVGVWPLLEAREREGAKVRERESLLAPDTLGTLRERVSAYMLKAAREAKAHTSWTDPDEAWEQALARFIDAVLSGESVGRVARFAARLTRAGMWNALARVLIHFSAPGTPDLYQGDELWNFALVDPDNRRPVDYALRRRLLDEIERRFAGGGSERERLVREIVESPEDGRIKLHVTRRTLQMRREHPMLFTGGEYLPLRAHGPAAPHIFAFARLTDRVAVVVVFPRLTLSLLRNDSTASETDGAGDARLTDRTLSLLIPSEVWRETFLILPSELAGLGWRCELTGDRVLPEAPQHVATEQQRGAHPQPQIEVNPVLDDSTGASRRGTAVAYASASQLSLEHVLRAVPAALLYARRPDV